MKNNVNAAISRLPERIRSSWNETKRSTSSRLSIERSVTLESLIIVIFLSYINEYIITCIITMN